MDNPKSTEQNKEGALGTVILILSVMAWSLWMLGNIVFLKQQPLQNEAVICTIK